MLYWRLKSKSLEIINLEDNIPSVVTFIPKMFRLYFCLTQPLLSTTMKELAK